MVKSGKGRGRFKSLRGRPRGLRETWHSFFTSIPAVASNKKECFRRWSHVSGEVKDMNSVRNSGYVGWGNPGGVLY